MADVKAFQVPMTPGRGWAEASKPLDPLELFDLPDEPASADMRDPGLYPGIQLFIANLLTEYLAYAPGRINALFSGYDLLFRNGLKRAVANVQYARTLFLDSGAISTLIAVMNGRATGDDVRSWMQRTPELVALGWQLHEAGSPPAVIAAMDLPAYGHMLGPAGLTVPEAERMTLENAEFMLAQDIPPGWRRVFTSQGITTEDHLRCLDGYEQLGVLEAVRMGHAWLAVGGMAYEGEPERVWTIHRAIRERVPVGHIHALGVSRVDVLVPMLLQGWVNSADSSSPCLEVRFNRGPYAMRGRIARPSFLVNAMHAAASLYAEAELASALAHHSSRPPAVQESLWQPQEVSRWL